MTDNQLRPSQREIMRYDGGKMGISAVPGAGKTFTLSYLAAMLVEKLAGAGLTDDQEVLVVTFTNPAVNSFRSRIARLVQQERGLLPYIGYRVRTLHGLAHDIVRMRPALVGLAEGFEIVDERITARIIRELAENWVRTNGERLLAYWDTAMKDRDAVRGQIRTYGPELVEDIGREVIRLGKDNEWEPDEMRAMLDGLPIEMPMELARIGVEFYGDYQRALSYRGAVDFDDLVRLAMRALRADPAFLERLQKQWPYILEDEAQDSSKLQNEMLRLLSGERNWVRVGDPNQSIYTTFTTANSNLLIRFLDERDVIKRPLEESGRSSEHIIRLANYLVKWATSDALVESLRGAFYPQVIRPTPPGDPQPNPANSFIYLDWEAEQNITPEREIERVIGSLERWLPDHTDWTVAVLVPENSRGFKLVEELKERNIPYEELLRSTTATRDAAARLQLIFDFLADPTAPRTLARLYHDLWWPLTFGETDEEAAINLREQVTRAIQELTNTEDFLWPGPEGDWLDKLTGDEIPGEVDEHLRRLRERLQIWLKASSLPVDQLALTIAQDLFTAQPDLALAHKIAVVLRGIANNNPDFRLPELAQELRLIADNQRRFLGFEDTMTGYEPRPGVVTVATMHAAKGLEWDRVYLMAVNNYSFPANQPGDSYQSEKWYIRDQLNVQAEVHRQAELIMAGRAGEYEAGEASHEARVEYAAERLRLLYVGITRARRDLVITWNMGRFWDRGIRNRGAAALLALHDFWKRELS